MCMQKSELSWSSSSNVWSSSRSRACNCCRTCRSSSAGRLRSSWSTPGAWRNWLNDSPPRYAAPESTSSSKQVFPGAKWYKMLGQRLPGTVDFCSCTVRKWSSNSGDLVCLTTVQGSQQELKQPFSKTFTTALLTCAAQIRLTMHFFE